MNDNQYIETKNRIKTRLDAAIEDDLLNNPPEKKWTRRAFSQTAAGLAVITLVILGFARLTQEKDGQPENWREESTSAGEVKLVSLPDGSRIWIHNNSRIMYPDSFVGDTRRVFTSGEIFAEIVSDPSHPFIVSSNGVNVCVKGTTFNFRSYADTKEAELTLLKGAVDMNLSVCGQTSSVSVKPGTTVKANLDNGRITQFPTDPGTYVSWKDASVIYFNDESLEYIAGELQRQFGVRIVIGSEALAKTRYYVSFFDAKSPMDIFEVLNDSGMMDITHRGDTYYINSIN